MSTVLVKRHQLSPVVIQPSLSHVVITLSWPWSELKATEWSGDRSPLFSLIAHENFPIPLQSCSHLFAFA
jgi:hypothetical protein